MENDPSSPALSSDANANSNLRTYAGITYDINDPKFQGLSRNAIKRLLKEERWEATREQRAKHLKERRKQKNMERRQKIEQGELPMPQPKRPRNANVETTAFKVVIDCAFSSYMSEKEMHSMQSQLVRCYSANRSAEVRIPFVITSFDTPLEETFKKKTPTFFNWKDTEFITEPYETKFDKSSLVYLSADSDHVAHELEDGKVYIIGGIVDKNRHKGLCQSKAEEQGIATAQLPIGDYLQMASRKVLTVNQVYEIMLKWAECRDWEKAFMHVIPKRKLKDSKWIKGEENANNESTEETEQTEGHTQTSEQMSDTSGCDTSQQQQQQQQQSLDSTVESNESSQNEHV